MRAQRRGWWAGEKEDYYQAAGRLARSGYVTASINYRLSTAGEFPAPVQDCWCALAFFRAHADPWRLDPNRVAVYGYSAGGHLVSMLGTTDQLAAVRPDCAAGMTSLPNAVVSGAGIHDFSTVGDSAPTFVLFGGFLADKGSAVSDASPIRHVRAGLPPFLLVTGTDDWFVSADQSVSMRDALREKGNDATLLTLGRGGHIYNPSPGQGETSIEMTTDSPEGWAVTMDFLRRTLGAP